MTKRSVQKPNWTTRSQSGTYSIHKNLPVIYSLYLFLMNGIMFQYYARRIVKCRDRVKNRLVALVRFIENEITVQEETIDQNKHTKEQGRDKYLKLIYTLHFSTRGANHHEIIFYLYICTYHINCSVQIGTCVTAH
jgi:hypothetical protein